MITAKLKIMGQISTIEPDGEVTDFPMALLLEFDTPEDIRQALSDMKCDFTFCAETPEAL